MPRTPPPRPPLVDETQHRVLQHAVYHRLHVQVLVNVFYSRVLLADYNATALTDFAEGFWTTVSPQWAAAVSNELTFQQIVTRVVGHPEVVPTTYAITTNNVGLLASESLPSFNAVICTLFSDWGGKRGRGRRYFAGVTEAATSLSVVNPASMTMWNALAARLKINWPPTGAAVGQLPFLWSRNRGTEAGTAGALVSDCKAVNVLGTQRRRRVGRGI